jgi:antiviral helicase SKI2
MDFEACLFACRCIKGEPAIEEYYEMYSNAEQYDNRISEAVMQSPAAQQFLARERVVVVKSQSVSSHL